MDNSVNIVRVADFLKSGLTDSEVIESAISYAKQNDIQTIVFDSKNYILDRAILFYSGATFIVDGVTLKLNNGVFDNVFRSENFIVDGDNPYGYPLDVKLTENFRIIGKNGATIEGPDVNPLIKNIETGELCEPICDIWGWRALTVYITVCKNFEFSGFKVLKTRSWAISLERATNGYLHDIEVYSICPNGDGINLRNGCSFITIENLKGATSDDLIALNNCSLNFEHPYKTWKTYLYPIVASNMLMDRESKEEQDIHDISINNVCGTSGIVFLARNGFKIYNVRVANISEKLEGYERRNIADMVGAYYTSGYGETDNNVYLQNIYIENVESNHTKSAVLFNDRVSNLTIKNVVQNDPEGVVLTAVEEDEVEIINCKSNSGVIRNSSRDWVNPMLKKLNS